MPRPFVYLNMAATVDGKITSAAREYPRFASAHDRRRMDKLRAEADAVMLGAGTLRADEPNLHVRDPAMRDYRLSLGKPAGLHRVLVSASLRVEPTSCFFNDDHGADRIVVTVEEIADESVAALDGLAEVWKIGRGTVDLPRLLARLGERGVERLLVEGGGELNWALVAADLVDELYVTIAPTLLGGGAAPTLLGGEGLSMQQQVRLRLVEVEREGDELFCRYAVRRA